CRTSLVHANPKNHHITVRNNISRSSITASSFLKKHSPSLTRVDMRTPHAWGGLSYRSADTAAEHVKILKVAFRFEPRRKRRPSLGKLDFNPVQIEDWSFPNLRATRKLPRKLHRLSLDPSLKCRGRWHQLPLTVNVEPRRLTQVEIGKNFGI